MAIDIYTYENIPLLVLPGLAFALLFCGGLWLLDGFMRREPAARSSASRYLSEGEEAHYITGHLAYHQGGVQLESFQGSKGRSYLVGARVYESFYGAPGRDVIANGSGTVAAILAWPDRTPSDARETQLVIKLDTGKIVRQNHFLWTPATQPAEHDA